MQIKNYTVEIIFLVTNQNFIKICQLKCIQWNENLNVLNFY